MLMFFPYSIPARLRLKQTLLGLVSPRAPLFLSPHFNLVSWRHEVMISHFKFTRGLIIRACYCINICNSKRFFLTLFSCFLNCITEIVASYHLDLALIVLFLVSVNTL